MSAPYDASELAAKADEIHDLAMEHTFFPSDAGGDGQEQAFRVQCALSHARGADECLGGSGGGAGGDARAEVSEYYRGLTDRILKRTRPSPAQIIDRVNDIEAVLSTLGFPSYTSIGAEHPESSSLDEPARWEPFTNIESALDEWSGDFKDQLAVYAADLKLVTDNLGKILGVLASATYTIRNINQAKRKTLTSIIDNTIDALDDTGYSGQGITDDGIDFSHALWAAGAGVSLLGLATPPGAAVALTLTGTAISAFDHFYPPSDDGNNLASNTAMPAHVLAKMASAIGDMHRQYKEDSRRIADHLREQNDLVREESERAPVDAMANCFVVAEPVTDLTADGEIYSDLRPG